MALQGSGEVDIRDTYSGLQAGAITEVEYDRGSGTVTLTWNSKNGKSYTIEISDNLDQWFELDDSVASGGATTTFVDMTIAPGTTRRNYRVLENP